jgi:hypothetical protein
MQEQHDRSGIDRAVMAIDQAAAAVSIDAIRLAC